MVLLEYVKKIPGHKNSKGEPAPWTIVSHKTGKVLSSHKTKAEAEEHLKHMHIFKESFNMTKSEIRDALAENIMANIDLTGLGRDTSYELGVDNKWTDRAVFYLFNTDAGSYVDNIFYVKVEEKGQGVFSYKVVGCSSNLPHRILCKGYTSNWNTDLSQNCYDNITNYCAEKIKALDEVTVDDDFFAMVDSFSESKKRTRGHAINETVTKNGLSWLADKIEKGTGLKFYGDLGEIDIFGDDNEEGVADYVIANAENKVVYLIKYLNGDFEIAVWKDDEGSPSISLRDPSPFRIANYAIENIRELYR